MSATFYRPAICILWRPLAIVSIVLFSSHLPATAEQATFALEPTSSNIEGRRIFMRTEGQMYDYSRCNWLHLPQFSGHLEKPNVYGQQEVFHCQRKKERPITENLKRKPWR
jgi:hypothetical protein